MTTNKNNKRKPNAARKLIPAIGMLTASAMMLASSTYAWFTMSREVEVTGIKMTATVPEDLQISLGQLDGGKLVDGTGILKSGTATVSTVTDDWSNSADISKYYTFGKLIPASSTNGEHIYFTPDAAGTGKEVKDTHRAILADDTETAANLAKYGPATAHVNTVNTTDGWFDGTLTYATGEANAANARVQAAAWDNTHDDGYYVDIPVWIRTSNTENITVKVEGYVTKQDGSTGTLGTDDDLYMATRVALLTSAKAPCVANTTVEGVSTGNNIIPLQNATAFGTTDASVLDSKNYTVTRDSGKSITDTDLYGINAANASAYTLVKYNAYNNQSVGTISAPAGDAEYGDPTQFYIRVWLDGEDENCWNDNAGQDWAIALKFSKI